MPVIHTERYNVESQPIGRGGFGDVYSATDLLFDQEVVIKTIAVSRLFGLDEPSLRHQFWREAVLGAKLKSPHIVRVLDYGYDRDGDLPFFVMEKIDGFDLSKKKGNLSFDEAGVLFRHILSALAAAHAKGVVHSDVSPENILFDSTASVYKLTDFGLAKLLTSSLMSRGSLSVTGGKVQYLPPEQWQSGERNEFTDLHALAVTIVELIQGKRPRVDLDFHAGRINVATEDEVFGPPQEDRAILIEFEEADSALGVVNPTGDRLWHWNGSPCKHCLCLTRNDLAELLYCVLARTITRTEDLIENVKEQALAYALAREKEWYSEKEKENNLVVAKPN